MESRIALTMVVMHAREHAVVFDVVLLVNGPTALAAAVATKPMIASGFINIFASGSERSNQDGSRFIRRNLLSKRYQLDGYHRLPVEQLSLESTQVLYITVGQNYEL
jgi:hypothetical protein